jgi:hypothetical protein
MAYHQTDGAMIHPWTTSRTSFRSQEDPPHRKNRFYEHNLTEENKFRHGVELPIYKIEFLDPDGGGE